MADRTIRLGWSYGDGQQVRDVTIEVDVHDRTGLLRDLTMLLDAEGVNIVAVNTVPSWLKDLLRMELVIQVFAPRQLVRPGARAGERDLGLLPVGELAGAGGLRALSSCS
jgi:(p)ppGpp synthase/HD superfamily hydrolase